MVAALISMSGHGPAVITVHVPQPDPSARKNRSRWNAGKTLRLVVTHWSLPFRSRALFQ